MSFHRGDRVRAKRAIARPVGGGEIKKGTKGEVLADVSPLDMFVVVQFVGEPGPIDAPVSEIELDPSPGGSLAGAAASSAAAPAAPVAPPGAPPQASVVNVVVNHSRRELCVGVAYALEDWRTWCGTVHALATWDLARDDLQLACSFRRASAAEASLLLSELAKGESWLRAHCPAAADLEADGYSLIGGTPS